MTRLKHLSIGHSELTEDFFANISQTILPNLQFLKIQSQRIFGQSLKSFTESLQLMKSIEKVVVNDSNQFYYQKNRSESKPRIICQVVVESEDEEEEEEEPDID